MMVDVICQMLIEHNCEWEFLNKKAMRFKIMASVTPDGFADRQSNATDDEILQEILARFLLRFGISIYKTSKHMDDTYLVDI